MKFVLSLCITLALIYTLNRSWVIKGNRVPPVGKFLDPFQGFWQNAEPSGFTGPSELKLNGLQNEVKVVYDSLLIPHIFASNDEDLYLAQGYVTATLRLWQMEIQVFSTAGRLSSILGPGRDSVLLNHDRNQRRLGLTFAAEHALEAMLREPLTKMMVEKYTDGVNRYIHTLRYRDLPLEYKLMDYTPEEWTPLKCALLIKSMAQTLNMDDKDIQMTNALNLFGKDMVNILYPDNEPGIDPIVDNPGGWDFDPVTLDSIPLALPKEFINVTQLPVHDPTIGSNNWAVDGSKTATGSPILCNDPHLDILLPSIWFAIQLHSPEVNTMGVSLPGAPGVVIGFNDSIAWGITNAQRDLIDWYKITYQDDRREKYKLDGKWVNTQKEVEVIEVRDQDPFYDTIIYTHWGPIPYDRSFRAGSNKTDYAFRWISHDASNEMMTFHLLNRAGNYDDYMKALDHFEAPSQNFAFASVSGDIAMRVQGKFPLRRKYEGKFALDGSETANGWQAFIPFEQNVMIKNPERGFVSSANQYPVDATYPYYITASNFEAYRNRRINDVLHNNSDLTIQDMKNLQNDNFNLKASESLPVFLSYLDTTQFNPSESKAYNTLKSWDYFNNIDSQGASYYEAWWDNLMPLIWDEMDRGDTALSRPTTYNTIKLIREQPDFIFFDFKGTPEKESAGDLIRTAFELAVEDIAKWKEEKKEETADWADYKDTYIHHMANLEPFSYHVRHGGNHDIVNASGHIHGPSWRMIVSLEKQGVHTVAVYPGGQSGNPGSAHYSDMLDAWAHGEYYDLLFLKKPDDAGQKKLYTTQLNP